MCQLGCPLVGDDAIEVHAIVRVLYIGVGDTVSREIFEHNRSRSYLFPIETGHIPVFLYWIEEFSINSSRSIGYLPEVLMNWNR
jgi:hypothetical protein